VKSFPDDPVGSGIFGVGAVSSVEPTFREPWWVRDRDKHWPLYSEDWTKVIRGTGGPEGVARYHTSLTLADIERMEIGCVAGPNDRDRGQEIVAKRRSHLKLYWKHMGRVVGASNGEETEYIFVEYGPMTVSQLRAKGAEL
jgi:hypothetical protein